jgi:hypothetical protein
MGLLLIGLGNEMMKLQAGRLQRQNRKPLLVMFLRTFRSIDKDRFTIDKKITIK